jgi:hypothetical protein
MPAVIQWCEQEEPYEPPFLRRNKTLGKTNRDAFRGADAPSQCIYSCILLRQDYMHCDPVFAENEEPERIKGPALKIAQLRDSHERNKFLVHLSSIKLKIFRAPRGFSRYSEY